MISLIQLTENDKRLLIVLLLVVILLFVIIGYLSLFIKKIMQFQAKKADDLLSDVYNAGIVDNEHKFRKYGIRKNWRLFFKQASVPFLILSLAWMGFALYGLVKAPDGSKFYFPKLWDYKEEGITTLFYVFDWKSAEKINFWGLKVYPGFPDPLNTPHFELTAWFSYIFVPANIVGIIWFLVDVQAYIARSYRIFKLSATLFRKTLNKSVPLDQQNRMVK